MSDDAAAPRREAEPAEADAEEGEEPASRVGPTRPAGLRAALAAITLVFAAGVAIGFLLGRTL